MHGVYSWFRLGVPIFLVAGGDFAKRLDRRSVLLGHQMHSSRLSGVGATARGSRAKREHY